MLSLGMGMGSCCETACGCPGPYTLTVTPYGIILTTRNEEEWNVAKKKRIHQPKLRVLEGWRGCSCQPGTEPFLGTPPVLPWCNSQRSYAPDLLAFVTALAAAPEKINTTEEPVMEDSSPPSHIKAVILGVLLLGCVVVLVVLGYCLVTYRRGGGELRHPAHRAEGLGVLQGTRGVMLLQQTHLGPGSRWIRGVHMGWFGCPNSSVACPCGTGISVLMGQGCSGLLLALQPTC